MTEHERLMLRRHLEHASKQYEIYANSAVAVLPNDPATNETVARYRALAQEARDFATRIRTKTLL